MIQPAQRFSRHNPCPVCGGFDTARRGVGARCYGYISDNGEWCLCTREEHAGPLDRHISSGTYAHRLTGPCRCGIDHGRIARPLVVPERHRDHSRGSYPPRELGTIDSSYVYTDPDGRPLHRTVRFRDPKAFRQQRYDRGRWVWGLGGADTVLYRLPALLAADPADSVWLPEGERDVDHLRGLGLVATTNPMGARSWRSCYNAFFADRDIIILEDNDDEGRARGRRLIAELGRVARRVRSVGFPAMPEGADVSDWLKAGGTIDRLWAAVDAWESALKVGA